MVKMDVEYNLNHIYTLIINSPDIATGSDETETDGEIELFEKSLALTSDLKRLPILRSLIATINPAVTFYGKMTASNVTTVRVTLDVYTDEDRETENQIWHCSLILYVDGTNHVVIVSKDEPSWDFEGGVLCFDKLYYTIKTQTETNVTTNDLNDVGAIRLFLEIDWAELKKGQFEQYILENIYAKQ